MSEAVSPDSIYLANYDPGWPAMFEEERARLQAAIGAWAADIQHVGSTSIPGIAAKPIIDIAVHLNLLVDALKCITPLVEHLQYECLGEFGIPDRIYFRKRPATPLRREGAGHHRADRTHQIHMYPLGHEQFAKQITFRDYLRAHPDAAREYEALKRELAGRHAGDVEAYADAKSDFVQSILRSAALARSPSRNEAERGDQATKR
jgi:GrpB-like predicted nucleotidyltransferase (UPF0157 family)